MLKPPALGWCGDIQYSIIAHLKNLTESAMFTIPGNSALSSFRVEKLTKSIQERLGIEVDIQA
ncbi:MAG: hypothetical protein R3240_13850, partial [Gammaproteobacteria bacterium]|nr:hypothetical protein [Gammaproteobacteria bacterium]